MTNMRTTKHFMGLKYVHTGHSSSFHVRHLYQITQIA